LSIQKLLTSISLRTILYPISYIFASFFIYVTGFLSNFANPLNIVSSYLKKTFYNPQAAKPADLFLRFLFSIRPKEDRAAEMQLFMQTSV